MQATHVYLWVVRSSCSCETRSGSAKVPKGPIAGLRRSFQALS